MLHILTDACRPREYDVTPETGLALVEVPGSSGMTSLSLPPGTYPIHRKIRTANCTIEYHIKGVCSLGLYYKLMLQHC